MHKSFQRVPYIEFISVTEGPFPYLIQLQSNARPQKYAVELRGKVHELIMKII